MKGHTMQLVASLHQLALGAHEALLGMRMQAYW